MNEFITYLVKVSLAIALISIPYYLLLRNDPSLLIKRIYLLSGIGLAWIFPLLSFTKPEIASSLEPVLFIDPGMPLSENAGASAPIQNARSISAAGMIGFLYLAGIMLLFARNIISFYLSKSKRNIIESGSNDIVITNYDQVFSIFPKVFLPKKYSDTEGLNSILIHERTHIRQLHFIDLLLSELSLVLTWFNPFSWLISRMIKENHEHLADRAVLSQGVSPAHYKALLLNHALGGQVFRLGHQFNHSLTKNRFKMMKKIKAPRGGFLKYIFIIPTILLLTLILTASAQNSKTIKGTVYLESIANPAIGASVIVLGTTNGTVVDKQGLFSLDVTGNPDIAVSFVGYKTVKISAKAAAKKPIIMEPGVFKLNLPEPGQDVQAKSVAIGSQALSDGEPVYILDGEKVESIEDVSPDVIESVSIIKEKDHELVKKYNATSGIVLITTKAYGSALREEEGEPEAIFFVVEDIPSFPGGKNALADYLYSNLEYPQNALEKGLEGKVLVQFTVLGNGSIQNAEIINSSNEVFNEAALKLIENMPNWQPGKQRSKPVRTNVQVPVRFTIPQE